MRLFFYLIYGLLQGITEPLPISSSGHLVLLERLFPIRTFQDLSFEIFLNFASFLAIFLLYRKDIFSLIRGFFSYLFLRKKEYYLSFYYSLLIIIGTIPVGLIGLFINDFLETMLFLYPVFVGYGFLFTGILLLCVFRFQGNKEDFQITILDALIIGFFQAIALVPGISRSGMTLIGCLLCGMSRGASLKFSFMLYLPVSVLTMILGVQDVLQYGISLASFSTYFLSMIFAFLGTIFSYTFLKRVTSHGRLWVFSIYLFLIGILSIFLLK